MKVRRVTGLLLLLVLAFAVMGGTALAQDSGASIVTGLNMVGGDVPSIDPTVSETSMSIDIVNQIFVGLTAQDVTTAETIPGIATDWTVETTDEGAVYTFNLRNDIPWVRYNAETDAVEQILDEDGNPLMVTAHDVVYGFLRGLDPETAAPYSYVPIPYIVGAAEFNAGEADASEVMVTAVDDWTVQIVAPEETAFAPAIYGLWAVRPVLQSVVEEGGDRWTEPEYIATNGPFALKEWAHDESITIVANPFWPGTDGIPKPSLAEVTYRFLDPAQQIIEFEAGNLDASMIPVEEIVRVQNDPVLSTQYVTGANPCTYYIGFDNTEAPTDNVHLRRALSFAIDRQSIVDNVTRGGQTPAQWFAYPGLNASPTLETHPDLGVKYDPDLAQEELALALEELGLASASELQLTITYNDSSGHAAIMQAIQQMWADTLGVQAELTAADPTTYFASLSEEYPMIARAGWCQDYSDANNFLYDVFFSQSSQNDPGFANEEYDALVTQARTEPDTDVRRELYAQAEEIFVVEQAAIAPIYWYSTNQLVRTGVEYAPSITGNEAYYLWSVSE
ncbi:MAG TPA: peptide ABC transporter substrate-binding protein [Oceanobacillus sp.]|nr:peptide ABC transporter substrate-binding protein [Oceanobacillus sp.]